MCIGMKKNRWRRFWIGIMVVILSGSSIFLGVEAAEAERENPALWIVAHRAGAAYAPENTIAALEQAIRDGAEFAEIDVRQLRDGTLIVMHDSNFLRTAGVDREVWETDFEDLVHFEVGTAFSEAYRGEGIPTLEQMLQCASDRICLMIELKITGHEKDLEASVLNLLRQNHMERNCIIGSMNGEVLKRMKELDQGISTVFISHDLTKEQYFLDYADSYSIEVKNLTPEMTERIHMQNKPVYGWTANSGASAQQVYYSGADGIVTDNVYLIKLYLREMGYRRYLRL